MTNKSNLEITLRPWAEDDLALLQRLLGDPAMTEHLGGPETIEKIRKRHQKYCTIGDTGTGRMFAITVGPEETAAGSIGYWEKEWQGQLVWETGWSVLPEFQGKGIATQAILAVIAWASMEEKHQFMHAYPSVDNGPSNAICRKAGFTLLGQSEFEYPPGNMFISNDWQIDLFANE